MARLTVSNLIDKFLTATELQSSPKTYKWYAHHLQSFRSYCGAKVTASITSTDVYQWLKTCWGEHSPNTQHAAARAVTRLFNFAVDDRLLKECPIKGFRKPSPTSRERFLTKAEYALVLKTSMPQLRDPIKFLWHTGCRPQELRAIEAAWVHGQKIIVPKELSKGKRKARVILLNPTAAMIAARLAKQYPDGPIFRNSEGTLWTKDNLRLAFNRLGLQVGIKGLCAYWFRHAFITRMLEKNVDVASVAALAGNSARMVLNNYNHVAANENRLLALL